MRRWFLNQKKVNTMAKVAAQKITPFLWFDKEAEEAVNLYVLIFKNAKINGLSRYTDPDPDRPGR